MAIIDNLKFKNFSNNFFISTANFFQPQFECYLANSKSEIKKAQRLRYKIFFNERNGQKIFNLSSFKRDADKFDKYCDHIIVTFKASKFSKTKVVGTYRLLQQKVALQQNGFYSSEEFNLNTLYKSPDKPLNALELSRSCVSFKFRKKNVLHLMWSKINEYVQYNKNDVLFGMASFLEENPDIIKEELSYLYQKFIMPENIRVDAIFSKRTEMNLIPTEGISEISIIKKLPPLIKAYLRLGAKIGDGAVVDKLFKTTDVFIYLPFNSIKPEYLKKFSL
jgi:putative hemolysin